MELIQNFNLPKYVEVNEYNKKGQLTFYIKIMEIILIVKLFVQIIIQLYKILVKYEV